MSTERDWESEDLAALCNDLSAACDRLGRPGPSNWAGLEEALGVHSKDRIVRAQRRIACDLTGGRNITSPFGLLAAAADAGHASHRIYFPPPRSKPPDRRNLLIDEGSQTGDDEAESAVIALDNADDTDALAELDRLVAASFAGRPRALESIRHDPIALLTARARAWRTGHPLPGGPQ